MSEGAGSIIGVLHKGGIVRSEKWAFSSNEMGGSVVPSGAEHVKQASMHSSPTAAGETHAVESV